MKVPLLNSDSVKTLVGELLEVDHRGVHLALGGVTVDLQADVAGASNSFLEARYRQSLLLQVALAFSVLRKGGSLVLQITDCFSRFTASLLWTIHR